MATMIRRRHRPGLVVLCMMLALVGFPLAGAAQGTASGQQPGVAGNQYKSPTYGYSLSWDSSWQVQAATSKNGIDTLELANGASYVGMEGYAGGSGGVQGCLDDGFTSLKNDKSVSNLNAAKGPDGKDLKGGNDSAAYAVYDLTLAGQSGSRDMTEFLACYALPQSAVLLITDTVPAENYNTQAPALQKLLGNLQIPSSSSSNVPNTQATAAPVSTAGASSTTTISLPQATAATGPGPQATSSGRQSVPIGLPGAQTPATGPTAPPVSTAPALSTATTSQGNQAGVQGNKYTSPTYGYSLHWESSWKVTKAESSNGDDYLELDNGTSNISFEGATDQGSTAQACFAKAKDGYSGATGVSNFQETTDQNNTPIAGSQDNDTWGVFDFDYKNSSGKSAHLAIYIECYGLPQPNATLLISQIVTSTDYNDQIDARSTLLKTLTIPGGTTSGAQTPQATAEATSTGGLVIPQLPSGNQTPTTGSNPTATAAASGTEQPTGPIIGLPGGTTTPSGPAATATLTTTNGGAQAGVHGSTYTSPTFGYSLSWDSTWKVTGATSKSGSDALQLDNGTSTISFTGGPAASGGAKQCLTDSSNASKSTPGFSDFAPAQAQGGGNLAGGDNTDAWAVYDFTFTASDGSKVSMTEYIECQTLPGNGMLTIDQIVPSKDYNDQIAARRTLFNSLKLPGGSGTPSM